MHVSRLLDAALNLLRDRLTDGTARPRARRARRRRSSGAATSARPAMSCDAP